MRNLDEYPITGAEILACLRRIGQDKARDAAPGDMDELLLGLAGRLLLKLEQMAYGDSIESLIIDTHLMRDLFTDDITRRFLA